MAESEQNTVFRQETLDRISSPEQLNGYLRVTGPGIWAVLFSGTRVYDRKAPGLSRDPGAFSFREGRRK